jgi:diguanylate cyclase (GGDEF)-like protein
MRNRPYSLSLNHLVLIITFLFLIATLCGIFFTSSFIKEKAINDMAQEDAYKTSKLVFQSLYSAMKKGWTKDEIMEIIARLNKIEPGMKISVLRGQPVIKQYGEIEGEKRIRENDQLIQNAFQTGIDSLTKMDEDKLRYIYPVKVEQECLECHKKAKPGDINGIIDISYPITNIKVSLDFIMNMVIVYLTIIMFLLSLALQSTLRSFIIQPLNKVTSVVQNVISQLDLSQRITSAAHITEIQHLVGYFNKMLLTIHGYNQKLEKLSSRDPMTGLYNRRKFYEFINHEVDRSERYNQKFSLLMLDLDNFKHINDTFGHPVGDLVLKKFTNLISKKLRSSDIFCRFGGDEFGILLAETEHVPALEVAEKLRKLISESEIKLPLGKISITASIGLITFPDNVSNKEQLISGMDIAMYKAKRSGKNRVTSIDQNEYEETAEIFAKGHRVRQALQEDRIDAYLQPIVNVEDNQIFAYEVLARIKEDNRIINAAEFMSLAEDLGMGEEIDMRVFEKGLEAKKLHKIQDIRLFFNLSPQTFCNIERMQKIPQQLIALGVSPHEIVLEITEREALPHLSELSSLINDLKEQGLSFALDDFGSGFSSFMYLKFLPVDFIKVEGTFVRHMAHDNRDRLLVEHIHMLSKKFGMQTIAEYVEDEATHKILSEIGIHYGQGYFYGHPLAVSDIKKMTSMLF